MSSPLFLKTYPITSVVHRAYTFAQEVHKDTSRVSGDPYITHCIAVAETVHVWHLDEASIAAAFLHDVVEDTTYTLKDITKQFGEEITFLVNGLTKLKAITYSRQEREIENLRKFVVSFSQDLRVLIIKLADRLHNMRTLNSLSQERQEKIAWETSEIYAPLAYRLGMQQLSGELEDLAFPYRDREGYAWLIKNIKEQYSERESYAEKIKPLIIKLLTKNKLHTTLVDARAKRYASLYKKLLRYDMDLGRIYDLVAIRIVVKNIEECYATLGLIHQLWQPLPGRIKDYIARPKPNGYRSLHTTVFCVDHKITEFQIRTQEMHDEAELGIAAHWAYQQVRHSEKKRLSWKGIASRKELLWVEQLKNWQKTFTDQKEFVESLKTDFLKDHIFVITPENDVIDLPRGATPIDFAYRIHSDIGDQCVGAKVNNKLVHLDYELHSGDIVEILTHRGKKPSRDWLRFVKTTFAKKNIRGALQEKTTSSRNTFQEMQFTIINEDRHGYYKDITEVFAKEKINITYMKGETDPRLTFARIVVRCAPLSRAKQEHLIVRIKKIPNTKEVSSGYYTRS